MPAAFNVAAGTYLAEVTVGASILLHGAGIDVTILMGRKDAGVATTLTIGANTTVEGFTITRDGNNPTDWNLPTIKSQGWSLSRAAGPPSATAR